MGYIVREIENRVSELEEKEIREMAHPNHQLSEEYPMETLDKVSMEDKIIMSREEDYPEVKELTPGEISRIVKKAIHSHHVKVDEEVVTEICFEVAYAVMENYVEANFDFD
jgi:hypothetical protein